ncbi:MULTISPECIES: rhodanese-like domain-containing protein [Thiomicrorhabdus]|uniref:Sulfurtransferase n=1 Tax=Thiomicrorhabdus heinhorstiae TaxID=2748010 RepID=A0ABS0BYU1_9GAMM|nr:MULTISPECIES: rhodanese-like domain-containing protein [Thiomicrorhabdus]MBF6058965.1 sulfurtransferase [Thiomicrorhabdus heinhorstiae]
MSKTMMEYILEAKGRINEVDLDKAQELMQSGYRILDVREPGEYLAAAIPGAINIPRGVLEPAADLEYAGANPALRDHREDPWVVVCKSGGRAALATDILQQMGFSKVVNMVGGMDAWLAAGKETEMPSTENSTVVLKEPCVV